MSIARLSRESGISETTIRGIGDRAKRQRSTLVALSAALGYPYDYLVAVLYGKADPEAPPPQSLPETAFFKVLLHTAVDPLQVKVDVIDGKVDRLLDQQRKSE